MQYFVDYCTNHSLIHSLQRLQSVTSGQGHLCQDIKIRAEATQDGKARWPIQPKRI